MRIEIIDNNITMLIADSGKMLTDNESYFHDIRLAHSEDVSKYSEIDEDKVPTNNNEEII